MGFCSADIRRRKIAVNSATNKKQQGVVLGVSPAIKIFLESENGKSFYLNRTFYVTDSDKCNISIPFLGILDLREAKYEVKRRDSHEIWSLKVWDETGEESRQNFISHYYDECSLLSNSAPLRLKAGKSYVVPISTIRPLPAGRYHTKLEGPEWSECLSIRRVHNLTEGSAKSHDRQNRSWPASSPHKTVISIRVRTLRSVTVPKGGLTVRAEPHHKSDPTLASSVDTMKTAAKNLELETEEASVMKLDSDDAPMSMRYKDNENSHSPPTIINADMLLDSIDISVPVKKAFKMPELSELDQADREAHHDLINMYRGCFQDNEFDIGKFSGSYEYHIVPVSPTAVARDKLRQYSEVALGQMDRWAQL